MTNDSQRKVELLEFSSTSRANHCELHMLMGKRIVHKRSWWLLLGSRMLIFKWNLLLTTAFLIKGQQRPQQKYMYSKEAENLIDEVDVCVLWLGPHECERRLSFQKDVQLSSFYNSKSPIAREPNVEKDKRQAD